MFALQYLFCLHCYLIFKSGMLCDLNKTSITQAMWRDKEQENNVATGNKWNKVNFSTLVWTKENKLYE